MADFTRLGRLTAALDPPFAAVDLAAFRRNATDLVRRAAGIPVRVAVKSVRCRELIAEALGTDGFAGAMSYSLPEAIWLGRNGVDDILMGYPTVHRDALRELAADPVLSRRITLMIDDVEQLELVKRVTGGGEPLRVCLDVDASLRLFGQHLGVRRSPLRTPAHVARLAQIVADDNAFELAGLMFYEAQIAGLPDTSPAVRWMKKRSAADLGDRRGAIVDAVKQIGPLDLVNSGGTGSLEFSGSDPAVTEVTAGSGLFGPTLFDRYDRFRPEPAAVYAVPVVRRPARRIVTVAGGGFVASGPASKTRLPSAAYPMGLKLIGTEGAGEVQTPVRGEAADGLAIGDRVWMRYAKAGELCERFDVLHLVDDDEVRVAPTYRGEGKAFG